MKQSQITITRNIPLLKDGKKVKDETTGYNVTEQITFKGTQVDFNNDLVLIPDYGKHKKCPVQTSCKLTGTYTKLIKNNLKALNMNYCYSADGYKGAYFGTKKTDIQAVMDYLKSIKVDKGYEAKITKIDNERKAKKNGTKQGGAVAKVGAKGDMEALKQQVKALNEMLLSMQETE